MSGERPTLVCLDCRDVGSLCVAFITNRIFNQRLARQREWEAIKADPVRLERHNARTRNAMERRRAPQEAKKETL